MNVCVINIVRRSYDVRRVQVKILIDSFSAKKVQEKAPTLAKNMGPVWKKKETKKDAKTWPLTLNEPATTTGGHAMVSLE